MSLYGLTGFIQYFNIDNFGERYSLNFGNLQIIFNDNLLTFVYFFVSIINLSNNITLP
jgi:hypothetical protein